MNESHKYNLIYFHIPTTMTAIVDSCIGGKTGINYKNIINSLGSYYHPRTVFISKNVINLIPKREFLAGIPEIIKSGVIDNNIITKMLINNKQKCLSRDFRFMSKLIQLSLKTKIKFFKNDIYENSKRLNLNFGHTFAHAIEMSVKTKNNDIKVIKIILNFEKYNTLFKRNLFFYFLRIH